MCHSTDSIPPSFGVPGRIGKAGDITLLSSDGTSFSAVEAFPETLGDVSVIVLPDVRGTHPYCAALVRRFAESGLNAVVIDYYGRTAGPGDRSGDFEWKEHFAKVESDNVDKDVAAAHTYIRELSTGPVFIVGFCFGGGQSWRLAASDLDLAGNIGFYGLPKLAAPHIANIQNPLLMLLAGEDVATTPAEFDEFATQLQTAGKQFEKHVYRGAPHSFFDAAYDQWQSACEDAWSRTLQFIATHRRDHQPA